MRTLSGTTTGVYYYSLLYLGFLFWNPRFALLCGGSWAFVMHPTSSGLRVALRAALFRMRFMTAAIFVDQVGYLAARGAKQVRSHHIRVYYSNGSKDLPADLPQRGSISLQLQSATGAAYPVKARPTKPATRARAGAIPAQDLGGDRFTALRRN